MNASIPLLCLLALSGPARANAGEVLWHFEVPAPASPLHRPSIGVDGTIYWSTSELSAITPSGQLVWSRPGADPNPVGIGLDGTLYIGGWQPPPTSHLPALRAFAPDGTHLWDFTDFGLVVGFIGGPNVGPDGNVYGVMFDGFDPAGSGIGAFSLTPAGSLRWHFDGFDHLIAGTVPSEIEFGDGQMYKAESHAPMPAGQQQSGLVALELDGDVAFQAPYGVASNSPHRQPRVSPLNGNVHATRPTRTLQTFDPAGNLLWYYNGAYTPTGFGSPAVGPDGSVYVINGSLHVIALDPDGNERWIAQNVVPNTARPPEVSPDGTLLVFGTQACFGGACPGRVIGLDTSDGSVVFDQPLPSVPGGVPTVATQPRFSHDGSVVYIGADAFTAFSKSYLFAVAVGEGVGVGDSFCSGDGSLATACPCGNAGEAGRGCDNSAATGGARLTATGSTSADTVVFQSTGELPSALSIFLQGDGVDASGVVFGDGVRCVAGALRRLYVKNAVGGVATAPQSSDASVMARSASLGDTISPGSTRWYQVYYRDPELAFCPPPAGQSFNVSNGLAITW